MECGCLIAAHAVPAAPPQIVRVRLNPRKPRQSASSRDGNGGFIPKRPRCPKFQVLLTLPRVDGGAGSFGIAQAPAAEFDFAEKRCAIC